MAVRKSPWVIVPDDRCFFDIILNFRGITLIIVFVTMILLTVLPIFIKYGGGKGSGVAFFSIVVILLLPAIAKLIMNALNEVISFDFSLISSMINKLI